MTEQTPQQARDLFAGGLYCAESVLLAITQAKNIQSDLIPKIATGFCSGIARSGGLCGAVSGAIMAISLFYGRNTAEKSPEENYDAVQELLSQFESHFETTNCVQLLNCDIGTEEGMRFFADNNLIEQCKNYVEEAARIALTIIEKKA